MSFFRRRTAEGRAEVRLAGPEDRAAISRLLHTADRRFLTSGYSEVPELALSDPSAVLEVGGRLMGALTFGWRSVPVAWLRTLLLQDELRVASALRDLGAPIYTLLRGEGISVAAITLDEWNAPWLRQPLKELGYRPVVEIVGYEKHELHRPSEGNQLVVVRPGRPGDLAAVLSLDAACFPLPWVKGPEIIGPALATSPCFLVAEFGGEPIGYAFATDHQGGRLFHLVRIAVAPAYRGHGVGVRLLAEVVDTAARRSVDVLTLNTQADNHSAQRLYEWFGFRRNGERQTVFELAIS